MPATRTSGKQEIDNEYDSTSDSVQLVLDSNIPYQINRLCHHMNRLLDQELQTHGLSIADWRVMAVLEYNSSVSVNNLANYAMIVQSTLSRQLQRMESEGYLENSRSHRDGRARNIALTLKGRKKYQAVREVTMRHIARIMRDIDSEQQSHLLQQVLKMQANIGEINPKAESECLARNQL